MPVLAWTMLKLIFWTPEGLWLACNSPKHTLIHFISWTPKGILFFLACFGPKPCLIHLFPRLPRECGWPALALFCCHFSMLVCNASARFRFLYCLCFHCRPRLDVFCNISGNINTFGLSSCIHLAEIFLQPFPASSLPLLLHGKNRYELRVPLSCWRGEVPCGIYSRESPEREREGLREGKGGEE